MSQVLNDYFCSVYTREDTTNVPNCQPTNNGQTIDNSYISPEVVEKAIQSLKPSTSAGPSGYSNKFLKDYCREICHPLAMIFRSSIDNNFVPNDWKMANVVPIFKKGSRGDPSNYRPVSLTCVVGKLLEKIIKTNIMDHLLSNSIIQGSQHGFMPSRSCVTNLLEFLEHVTSVVDSGSSVDIIYYDFSKAFDKVPHIRLINKLKSVGISGYLLNWISNWLTNRKQRTNINGHVSPWSSVLSGVPQGSVLGPLLFIIFINDIDMCATLIELLSKFADDTKSGNRCDTQDDRDKLQACIDNLAVWAETWGMEFNSMKCKVLHIGRNNPENDYYMRGVKLQDVDSEKDIGVHITKSLKPSEHCRISAQTAKGVLNQILRSFLYRDKVVFKNLYTTYVRPHLEFASAVWSPWLIKDIEILEEVQEKFVRNVQGLKGRTYLEKLNELGLMSLQTRRIYIDLVEAYKIIYGYSTKESSFYFNLTGSRSRRQTRLTDYPRNIILSRSNLDSRKYFFSQRVAEPWNNLPTNIKDARSIGSFKYLLKSYMLSSNSGHQDPAA